MFALALALTAQANWALELAPTRADGVYRAGEAVPFRARLLHDGARPAESEGYSVRMSLSANGVFLTNTVASAAKDVEVSASLAACGWISAFAMGVSPDGKQLARTPEEDGIPCSLHFVNNVVAVDRGPLICANARKVEGVWANNLWYDYCGEDAAVFGGLTWGEWGRAGKESGSCFADPKFRDPKAFDFTLEADSPAFRMGFRSFSLAEAGARGPTGAKSPCESRKCNEQGAVRTVAAGLL